MSSASVRCSLPEALTAPRTVPTRLQLTPAKATKTMNQRMETIWVTPQQLLDGPPEGPNLSRSAGLSKKKGARSGGDLEQESDLLIVLV